ncbi:hypothetical protein [Burkholderia contaminans]|uniref:hypothetical protein n=1 Tax=Burkholderia contaminans TaxID=488447 RepID=UPI0015831205|nr:hypothetical protein [Burkholderia contaminans]
MRFDKLNDFSVVALEIAVVALHVNVVARVRDLAALAADLANLGVPVAVIGEPPARREIVVAAIAVPDMPLGTVRQFDVACLARGRCWISDAAGVVEPSGKAD